MKLLLALALVSLPFSTFALPDDPVPSAEKKKKDGGHKKGEEDEEDYKVALLGPRPSARGPIS
jgi:hypothetical protein